MYKAPKLKGMQDAETGNDLLHMCPTRRGGLQRETCSIIGAHPVKAILVTIGWSSITNIVQKLSVTAPE